MKAYTETAKQCLKIAEKVAKTCGNIIDSTHLLVGLVDSDDTLAKKYLIKKEFTVETAHRIPVRVSVPASGETIVSPTVHDILRHAENITTVNTVSCQEILLSILHFKNCPAAKILQSFGIDYASAYPVLSADTCVSFPDSKIEKNDQPTNIDSTCKNKIIGREKELEEIISILSRKTKHNVLLLGESGVGKSALIQSVKERIDAHHVPEILYDYSVIPLNVTETVAGTRYRGDLEEKLKEFSDKVQNHKHVITIDGIENIFNIGGDDHSSVIQAVLKPLLEDASLRFLTCTTHAAFSRYFDKNQDFSRRFVIIDVKETDVETTIGILKSVKVEYEKHYHITIMDETIESIVRLSDIYLKNRYFPDKALDTLDDVCMFVCRNHKKVVEKHDVAKRLSDLTGLSIEKNNPSCILSLKDKIKNRLFGQEEAVDALCSSIMRAYAGLRSDKKPIGSFVFLGRPGIGKTQTAKILSEELFGSTNALVRFDMSEYSEKSSVSKLIGSAPGYIGYDEGGVLTERVKKNPHCVLLFDEIEKANPEVFDIFLQILDNGLLTDARGVSADFRNTIIIMTSNIGSERIVESANPIGFGEQILRSESAETQIKAFRSSFRPEFINRIDKIIVFNNLSQENIRQITDYIIEEKTNVLFWEKGIRLTIAEEVKIMIVDRVWKENDGARPILRAIETFIENGLSKVILTENVKNTVIDVSLSNGKVVYTVKQ